MKPGIKPFYIHDSEYRQSTDSLLLTQNIYFIIEKTDSIKNEIYAYGLSLVTSGIAAYKAYIDSSFISYFDLLPMAEKRERIEKTFNEFSKKLKKNCCNNDTELFYESVYSPMRSEFVKYWQKTKDSELLKKWFRTVKLNGGAADGLDSKALGTLFISFPREFSSILNEQSRKLKTYIMYRLTNCGICYVTETEEDANRYIELLNEYTK